MSDDDGAKIAFIGLNFYPPTIRQDVIKSELFSQYSSRFLQQWVHFGSDDLSFLQSEIYGAFRAVLQGDENCYITDRAGHDWKLSQLISPETVSVRFEHDDTIFLISDCYGLHPDAAIRTEAFNSAARKDGMTSSKYQAWLAIISSRTLEDDEMSLMLDQLSKSPGNVERKIREHMASRAIDYPTLIPDFDEYYVDLVGDVGACNDIFTFAVMKAQEKFRDILDFERENGLKRILGFSSHSALVKEIDLKSIELAEVEALFDLVAENSDVLSKVGAVELAVAYGECSPKIISRTINIIEGLRNADPSQYGLFTQFCDLVLLVGGEFSRNALFVSSPPYWRRLAIFSHAAVLQRAVLATNTDIAGLSDSQSDNRAPLFLIQTAVDLRLEPRWQSGYLGPEQLKAEVLGRIFMTAERQSETIHEQLRAYILDDPTFRKEVKFPFSYLPGPLEGGLESTMTLPQDLLSAIESALLCSPLELSSFVPLVNSALVFKMNGTQADLASKALQAANYQLRAGNNTENLEPVLAGIATVAAVTRSPSLGDEVIVLMRVLRKRSSNSLEINQILSIGLIAAASRAEERDWLDFVGRLFIEVCFGELTQADARLARFVLRQLCRLKPELWRSAGGAHAALESILPSGE